MKEKCAYLLHSVEYLGHVISKEGLCTADSKVEAIAQVPARTNVSELHSFLGLVNYYGKFLPNLATVLSLPSTFCYKKPSAGVGVKVKLKHLTKSRATSLLVCAHPFR